MGVDQGAGGQANKVVLEYLQFRAAGKNTLILEGFLKSWFFLCL